MRKKEKLLKLLYLGYDRRTIFYDYVEELNYANLFTLRTVSSILAMSLLVSLVVLAATNEAWLKLVIMSGTTVVFIIIFAYTQYIIKRNQKITANRVMVLIYAVWLSAYLLCAFLATYKSYTQLSVMVVVLFAILPATFFLVPHVTLCMSLPLIIIFLTVDYFFKERSVFRYDVFDSLLAFVLGMAISTPKMKNKLDGITTSRNLYHLSVSDPLTGLNNRTSTFKKMEEELRKSRAFGECFFCIVLDIDDFKLYNDTHGHPEGDVVIAHFGKLLSAFGKEKGVVIGRIGGEEFLLTGSTQSEEKAEELCILLLNDIRKALKGYGNGVTASLGLHVGVSKDRKVNDIYIYADNALYAAKKQGKDCCCKYNAETLNYDKLMEN